MILLIAIFYLISLVKEVLLWLILPISLFFDLWKLKPLGLSGLQILLAIFLLRMLFVIRRPISGKYKIN